MNRFLFIVIRLLINVQTVRLIISAWADFWHDRCVLGVHHPGGQLIERENLLYFLKLFMHWVGNQRSSRLWQYDVNSKQQTALHWIEQAEQKRYAGLNVDIVHWYEKQKAHRPRKPHVYEWCRQYHWLFLHVSHSGLQILLSVT